MTSAIRAAQRQLRALAEAPPSSQPTPERMARTPYGKARQILTIDGRRQEVSKIKTTIDHLRERGHLEPYMTTAIERLAFDIAYALNARNVEDYSGEHVHVAQAYGPRTVSIRQLDGIRVAREILLIVPENLRPLFEQILAEEVGLTIEGAVRPPKAWGHDIGRKSDKQAIAAGDTMIRDLCALVANYYERGLSVRSRYGAR